MIFLKQQCQIRYAALAAQLTANIIVQFQTYLIIINDIIKVNIVKSNMFKVAKLKNYG